MKLEEGFRNAVRTDNGLTIGEVVSECVTIADNYAEEFGKWLRENDDESLMMSHLLEIFYNEKKL
jgi:hypothetical protein